MINNIELLLKKHGFTDYEAKAYTTIVSMGQGTAREISEISGVPQGRIYSILNNLVKKGFLLIESGSPAYYQVSDPVDIFASFKETYSNSIDELINNLNELQESTPPSIWNIKNEKGIYFRLKLLIQNAKEDLLLIALEPQTLKLFIKDLKIAQKKVNVTILVKDKNRFEGIGIRVIKMSNELQDLFSEMMKKSPRMHDSTWKTEIYLITDYMDIITVGSRGSVHSATVYNMPAFSFMIHRLFELLEPVVLINQ